MASVICICLVVIAVIAIICIGLYAYFNKSKVRRCIRRSRHLTYALWTNDTSTDDAIIDSTESVEDKQSRSVQVSLHSSDTALSVAERERSSNVDFEWDSFQASSQEPELVSPVAAAEATFDFRRQDCVDVVQSNSSPKNAPGGTSSPARERHDIRDACNDLSNSSSSFSSLSSLSISSLSSCDDLEPTGNGHVSLPRDRPDVSENFTKDGGSAITRDGYDPVGNVEHSTKELKVP